MQGLEDKMKKQCKSNLYSPDDAINHPDQHRTYPDFGQQMRNTNHSLPLCRAKHEHDTAKPIASALAAN